MNASTTNVLSVCFNKYESTVIVFGVGFIRNESTVNVGVDLKLKNASILVSTPEAVDASIGVMSLRWLSL